VRQLQQQRLLKKPFLERRQAASVVKDWRLVLRFGRLVAFLPQLLLVSAGRQRLQHL
jgi:hypothetical protein